MPAAQIPLTKYDFTIKEIDVTLAEEPPADVTYDTGFNEWGELGLRVVSSNPAISGNPIQTGCLLGAASTGTKLSACKAGKPGDPLFSVGKPIWAQVTVGDPKDQVYVGFALDNVEGNGPSSVNPGLQAALSETGNDLQVVGGVLSLAGGPVGGVVALVGAACTVVATDLGTGAGLPTGGELYSCGGGLMGANWNAFSTGNSTFSLSGAGYDTIYFAPAARQAGSPKLAYFTPQDLADLTASGDVTLEADVSEQDPLTWIEWTGTPSPTPGAASQWHPCSSSHKIFMTIGREWNTGLGPSPKSGDGATARLPTESDSFWPDTIQGTIDRRYVDGSGWELSPAGSKLSLTATTPIASVSRAPAALDVFWVDEGGMLGTASWANQTLTGTGALVSGGATYSAPAHAPLTAATRTPATVDVLFVANDGAVVDFPYAPANAGSPIIGVTYPIGVTGAGAAAPGSGVAAVARTPTTLDVFFVNASTGALMTNSSSDGGATWGAASPVSAPNLAPASALITATAPTTESLDAFFVGNTGALYQASWTPALGWRTVAISAAGMASPGASVSAVSRLFTNVDVAFVGTGGALYWASSTDPLSQWSQGSVWSFASLPRTGIYAGNNVSLVARTSTNLDVYFHDAFGNPYTEAWDANSNVWTLSQIPLAPTSQSFQVTPASVTIPQDRGAGIEVTTSGSWATPGCLTLSAEQLPSGVTATFGAPVAAAGGGVSAQLSLQATSNAPTQPFQILVTGACNGTEFGAWVQGSVTACTSVYTCASMELSCGSFVDACGRTQTCGFCSADQTCSQNHCCDSGQTYNPVSSNCWTKSTCTTSKCICQQNGGTWTGTTCKYPP